MGGKKWEVCHIHTRQMVASFLRYIALVSLCFSEHVYLSDASYNLSCPKTAGTLRTRSLAVSDDSLAGSMHCLAPPVAQGKVGKLAFVMPFNEPIFSPHNHL
eukprot:scaffold132136_cov19-Prasinocladus_malaysianus.AAC.1